ncbi:MAG: MFS transporter, partial [Chloroflexi bacterium]|nr:MFS transporter [Chloroflexota bacterium]
MSASRRAALFLITITFIAFISLGSPDGLMDIANPHVRADFGIGTDVFSLIFITGFTGYFLSSFFAGQLVMRLGIGLLLSASCLATGLALLGN